ncbi:unnamed protein product [Prorocentrum cordatum]|uniref:Cellulase n=1 Tax=Prorocentrum cordatum TaxID=2364126 RepID=A0ABN9S936_9DINO|nr:unnamed protein product [Polarella glacialis]
MELVKEVGILAFAFEGGGRGVGTCYSEAIDVTDDLWAEALNDRVDLTCPGGAWVYNEHASTCIMNASMFGDLFDDSSLAFGAAACLAAAQGVPPCGTAARLSREVLQGSG